MTKDEAEFRRSRLLHYIAADTGGTFTDVTVYDAGGGGVRFGKQLTTYENLVDGVAAGIAETKGNLADAAWLRHGTTHVINAFLQRRGAKAALIATSGFRDTLEIGRGNRPVPFDLSVRRAPPLIPRFLRFEATERVGSDGTIIEPLADSDLATLIPKLKAARVEAVAVSFLNAYANPLHEQRAVAYLSAKLPGVYITSGTSLTREWFEFERTSTVAANAYVGPSITAYVAGFSERLEQDGFNGTFNMMGSNGGVIPVAAAIERPVSLVESGPIGGVLAAAEYAKALNLNHVIAFDMGGTTAKCAIVENGTFEVQSTYWVGGYATGFPIRSPVLDIVEVGAGGGSIASVDPQGRLGVGPQSAGSTPGPACFGNGGVEATVTDANLLLGRIGRGSFLGGRLTLDHQAAATAIREQVVRPMGYENDQEAATRVAHGVLDLATTLMTGAIKEVTVARGHDVRDFALMAFGGGGPIFAAELACQLGVSSVIIPPHPGNFSTIGMLLAGERTDIVRSLVADLSPDGIASLQAVANALQGEALEASAKELSGQPDVIRWQADMRYRGQRHSLTVDFEGAPSAANLTAAFEAAYAQRFGRVLSEDFAPEVIGLHAIAERAGAGLDLSAVADAASPSTAPKARTTRKIHLKNEGWADAAIWDRAALPIGMQVEGPAIIEEFSATTLVGRNDIASIGALGEIVITVGKA
jgi:N-methylhydantoinase A